MKIQDEVKQVVAKAISEHDFKHVEWIAAGGSYGGFYPADYFMTHEATVLSSRMHTSNEFVFAPPATLGESTICIVCSMRGTKETCEAARIAKDHGAYVIAIYVEESQLTEVCDQKIKYESIALDESKTERVNSSVGLLIAANLVNQTEGYARMNEMEMAFEQVDSLYREAVVRTTPIAQTWAQSVKDAPTIYVMGSGPAYGSAYIFSICNIEEMLQKSSPTINSCEFFHGPFEVLVNEDPIFQLVSYGRCRPADMRAVNFLSTYAAEKTFVLDAVDLGITQLSEDVAEYFNHVLFSPILNNVFMRELSKATGKDYMTRTYMWKVPY